MLIPSPIQKLPSKLSEAYKIELWIKRDDQIHDIISGNKFRKLKYNIQHFKKKNYKEIITFGGQHSNHIIATAYLCSKENIKCTGIIRGEKMDSISPTLASAIGLGMNLKHVSRSEYRNRTHDQYLSQLQTLHPDAYIIPEGGANEFGVKGCEDIVLECNEAIDFDYITVDCGTGATLAGMTRTLRPNQKAIGVQVLKGDDFISKEIEYFSPGLCEKYAIWTDYHFGGYAKYQDNLIEFMRWFYNETKIKLDPIYTGKQFYAVFDQMKKGYFVEGSRIVLTHTGGLQGIEGFEKRYGIRIY